MAHDVFISYAHDDRTVANAVVATLESHGIRCWIAPRDILPGEDWGEAILDAIKEAHALVLIFSSHSNKSEQIKREVERTVNQGLAVIPFRIEDVLPSKTLEYFISTQHWLDALTPPLEDHLTHLADTITVLLAKKGLKEKPPHVEAEAPAPPRPERRPEASPPEPRPAITVSSPPRKSILLWLTALVALLMVLAVVIGIWWRWSRSVVPAPRPQEQASPVAKPPVKLSAAEYFNKGNEAEDPEEKIKFYTKAIEINPYNAQYHYYRGMVYNAKSLFPLAIEDFNKAITHQENYPAAYQGRGDAYYQMGQFDVAIAEYTKAFSLDPRNAVVILKRGNAFLKKGQNEKALADFNESIRLKPDYAIALNNRGLIFMRKGENGKALADYNQAIRSDPNYVLAYKNRAALNERMGNKEQAAADRNKAKALASKGGPPSF
jgi:Tfp pilus assembly protein PilF